jgi:hypothetical protein
MAAPVKDSNGSVVSKPGLPLLNDPAPISQDSFCFAIGVAGMSPKRAAIPYSDSFSAAVFSAIVSRAPILEAGNAFGNRESPDCWSLNAGSVPVTGGNGSEVDADENDDDDDDEDEEEVVVEVMTSSDDDDDDDDEPWTSSEKAGRVVGGKVPPGTRVDPVAERSIALSGGSVKVSTSRPLF